MPEITVAWQMQPGTEEGDYYEHIRQLETDININVDGGTPTSTELLIVDGGTPFTTDYDKYNAGKPHTI